MRASVFLVRGRDDGPQTSSRIRTDGTIISVAKKRRNWGEVTLIISRLRSKLPLKLE